MFRPVSVELWLSDKNQVKSCFKPHSRCSPPTSCFNKSLEIRRFYGRKSDLRDVLAIMFRFVCVLPSPKVLQIFYISISINKKLKLSDLDFRQNTDYFCSISLMKIVPIKATAELLCVSEQHSGVSLLNESTVLNESSESMIQWPIHKDSHLPRF